MFAASFVATVCSGLFAGAALYINLVEHPARMEAGLSVALAEFPPSYRRAAFMQACLAIIGSVAAALAWASGAGTAALAAAAALFAVVPFTLIVVFPTNKELLDPALDRSSGRAEELLARWARLHGVRSVLGSVAFVLSIVSFAP